VEEKARWPKKMDRIEKELKEHKECADASAKTIVERHDSLRVDVEKVFNLVKVNSMTDHVWEQFGVEIVAPSRPPSYPPSPNKAGRICEEASAVSRTASCPNPGAGPTLLDQEAGEAGMAEKLSA